MGIIGDMIFRKKHPQIKTKAIRKPRKKNSNPLYNIPLEDQEQAKLVEWLVLKKIRHASTPNENNMSKLNKKTAIIQGAKAKKTGMQSGFPDITIFLKDRVLFIEMKRSKKSLTNTSDKQKEWVSFLDSLSYSNSKVCYGFTEAKEYIEGYI